MKKFRKRRKSKKLKQFTSEPGKPIPVKRRSGKIVEADSLYSILHKAKLNPKYSQKENLHINHALFTVGDMATWVLEYYNCDFHAASQAMKQKGNTSWDWSICQPIYDNFSYKKIGTIQLYQGRFRDQSRELKRGIFMLDGLHRSVSLACLLLQDKIEFQPIPVEINFYKEDTSFS